MGVPLIEGNYHIAKHSSRPLATLINRLLCYYPNITTRQNTGSNLPRSEPLAYYPELTKNLPSVVRGCETPQPINQDPIVII